MQLSTHNLILRPDSAIDLQVHTNRSDGDWTPDALLDHLHAAGFALAAITDHDRPDTAAELQALARDKRMPLVVACEMSGLWRDEMTDFLCFGFDANPTALQALADDVLRRQCDNSRQVYGRLVAEDCPLTEGDLVAILAMPSSAHMDGFVAAMTPHYADMQALGNALMGAGFAFMTHPPAAIVEAAHHDGALCMLAHPGRPDFPLVYDVGLLDALRAEAPIDGLEAYYPTHTPDQTAQFVAYAERHDLLISAGSDSHRPKKPPIPYRAEQCRKLLERLGLTIAV